MSPQLRKPCEPNIAAKAAEVIKLFFIIDRESSTTRGGFQAKEQRKSVVARFEVDPRFRAP